MAEVLYRYVDSLVSTGYSFDGEPTGSRVDVRLHEFTVLKRTAKGAWIALWGGFRPIEGMSRADRRFVLDQGRKRFAHETPNLALASFIARKNKQINIYRARVRNAEIALRRAQEIGAEARP